MNADKDQINHRFIEPARAMEVEMASMGGAEIERQEFEATGCSNEGMG